MNNLDGSSLDEILKNKSIDEPSVDVTTISENTHNSEILLMKLLETLVLMEAKPINLNIQVKSETQQNDLIKSWNSAPLLNALFLNSILRNI